MRKFFKPSSLALAINMALLSVASAHAQETTDNLPQATLEPIVVTAETDVTENSDTYTVTNSSTATGLDLSLQETPQSVIVITNQQMKDTASNTISDVLNKTTGITSATNDGRRTGFVSRGFAIDQFRVDGMDVDFTLVWTNEEHLANTIIYDKVEVTRGATGLMTGSGEPSASVNLVRKRANSTTPTTEVSAHADKFGYYGASIDHSQPLSQNGNVRGRFIASYSDGDTFMDREERGQQVYYGVIDADIGDSTSVGVGASYQFNKSRSTIAGGLPVYFNDGTKTDWDVGKNTNVDWATADSKNLNVFADMTHYFNNNWQVDLKASYSKNETPKLSNFYPYTYVVDKATGQFVSPTATPVALMTSNYENDREQYGVQANIKGEFDAFGQTHQLMAGASYNENKLTASGYDINYILSVPSFYNWDGKLAEPTWNNKKQLVDLTTKENGVFVATQLKPSEDLSILLGSRLSNFEREGINNYKPVSFEAKNEWTPYAGITYNLTDNYSVYASYTDIFKPQSERTVSGDYLDPIQGKNYEVGVKGTSADGRLQGQLSVFKIEQDNLAQLDNGKMVTGTAAEQAYYAADGATSEGVEVEVSGRLTDNLQASIGYSHYNAKDRDDNPLNTRHPDTTIKAFATYDLSNVVNGLTVGAGVSWMNERYAIIPNPVSGPEKYKQDPVALVDLMARYKVSDNLEAQLNIHNALDEKYYNAVGFYNQNVFGEPLNVSGSVTYRF